ncbi:MAG TPA: GNAT family N-acetyltransferase [Burkholderiaceae bacterium]|nr:GNAT family N-acetyltransferase [Burkholderiaceae bacterium]
MSSAYTLLRQTPSVQIYRRLRQQAGLSDKSDTAAARGLRQTLFAVQLLQGEEVVGMGRVIGDDGCFYQVVDIAVLPAHQGQGLGRRIMAALCEWLHAHAPRTAYVSLIADGEAHRLYAQFGFQPTAPASIGMALKL